MYYLDCTEDNYGGINTEAFAIFWTWTQSEREKLYWQPLIYTHVHHLPNTMHVIGCFHFPLYTLCIHSNIEPVCWQCYIIMCFNWEHICFKWMSTLSSLRCDFLEKNKVWKFSELCILVNLLYVALVFQVFPCSVYPKQMQWSVTLLAPNSDQLKYDCNIFLTNPHST